MRNHLHIDPKRWVAEVILSKKGKDFNGLALALFRFQARANPVYKRYLKLICCDFKRITKADDIPCMPVELFKTNKVLCEGFEAQRFFKSSGTLSDKRSVHYIPELRDYRACCLANFEKFYGAANKYTICALLPSFNEKPDSSLACMADTLIRESGDAYSGFYLHQTGKLRVLLKQKKAAHKPILLLGLSYALKDFADSGPVHAQNAIVMETGGMKGRHKEWIREELHAFLKKAFGVSHIHSEYGMCELMSQAYATAGGRFLCPPWMRIKIAELNDPFSVLPSAKPGKIQIIDLANVYSCAFLSTQDIGVRYPDGSFEVLGRFDHSDLRGCNLLMA